jgi:chromosome segregation ATPase
MKERTLAQKLSLLATEVDSLEKAYALSEAERAREADRRARAEAQVEDLRVELKEARRRAKAAEHALVELSATNEADAHRAETGTRELQTRLDEAEQAKKVLRHEVEETERERRALESNLREVLGNLREAARREAHRQPGVTDEATLVPSRSPDVGW